MHEQHFPRKVTEAIERECSVIDLAMVVRDDPPKKEHPWRDWRGGSVFGFFWTFIPSILALVAFISLLTMSDEAQYTSPAIAGLFCGSQTA